MSLLAPVSKKWLEAVDKRKPMGDASGHSSEVPCDASLFISHAAKVFNISRYDAYTNPELGVKITLAANELYGLDAFCGWGHAVLFVDDYGGKIKWPTGWTDAPYVEEYPLKTPEDIEKLEVKDVDELSKGPTYAKLWKALETAEKLLGRFFTPWSLVHSPYDCARNFLGDDKLLRWTVKEPKLIHTLLKKCLEHDVNVVAAVLRKYGRCSIETGSVFANSELLSPKHCREFNIIYLKEMLKRVLTAGAGPGIFIHLCGDHSLDWRLHKDVQVTPQTTMHVANDGREPMDLTEVIKVFGKKCVIRGNVSTNLMLHGTPKEVYEEAKRQILAYQNSPRGFVLGLSCELPGDTPPVNVHALVKATRDLGSIGSAKNLR